MTSSGGYEDEMDDVRGLSEASLDRLLAGRAPADEDILGLSRFAQDLRAAFVAAPATAVEQRHLAAIAGAARLHNDQTQQRSMPRAPRVRLAALLPAWRRNIVLSGFFGSLTAKILAGTAAAAAATGGLAASNLLPPPVQHVVAGVAGTVGIDLPQPGERAATSPAVDAGRQVPRATEILDALVKQVTDAAGQPHQVGLPVAQAAQACASRVSTIASELAEAAARTSDPDQALSLAQRAMAIAHEAVGCALPKPAEAGAGIGSGETASVASTASAATATVATGAAPIVDAVTECAQGLKPGIMQLVQWAMAKMSPASATAVASQAAHLADRAGECAGHVGTAAKTAFAFPMPVAIPHMPNLPGTLQGKLPVPAAPASGPAGAEPQANPAPAPVAALAPAPGGALPGMTPSWWSAVPFTGTTGPGTGQQSPAGPWMGMTGSWGNVGQWMPAGPWNPFQPAPHASPTP